MNVDLGLFVLRLVIGGVILAHGLIKIGRPISTGMRGMAAVRGVAGFFGGLGFWPPMLWALVAIVAEIGGGLLMILGIGGPIGPAIVFGDLVIVTLVAHWPQGFWVGPQGKVGIEFPISITAGALAVALIGHGGWSLDTALGLAYPEWLTWAALLVALAGDIVLLAVRAVRGVPAQRSA